MKHPTHNTTTSLPYFSRTPCHLPSKKEQDVKAKNLLELKQVAKSYLPRLLPLALIATFLFSTSVLAHHNGNESVSAKVGENLGGGISATSNLGCVSANRDAKVKDTSNGNPHFQLALGCESIASGYDSFAIGFHARSSGNGAIGVGFRATASAINAIAIGHSTNGVGALANYSIAIGSLANVDATAIHGIALGGSADIQTNSTFGIALGRNARIDSNSTFGIAIGEQARILTNSTHSLALGRATSVNGDYSIAFGANAKTDGNNSINISTGINARGTLSSGSIAIGADSHVAANSSNSTSIGLNALVSAPKGLALGAYTVASGESAIALGSFAKSYAANSLAIGASAINRGERSLALGSSVGILAGANDSIGIGSNISVRGNNSIIINSHLPTGTNANSTIQLANFSTNNAINIGNSSHTSVSIGGIDLIALNEDVETLGTQVDSIQSFIADPTNLQGEKGDAGVQGEKGDTGAQGTQGEKGDTGAQGAQGEKGDTGAPGTPSITTQGGVSEGDNNNRVNPVVEDEDGDAVGIDSNAPPVQAQTQALDTAKLESKIDKVKEGSNRGVAIAIAMENTPLSPGKTKNFSLNIGNYAGETALGASSSWRVNTDTQINAGIGLVSGQGNVGSRLGMLKEW